MADQKPSFTMPVTILLADASKSYREITRKMLSFYDSSFIIEDCASIDECLRRVASRAYDILIVNEHLEGGDCLGLLSAIRQEEVDIPVLVLCDEGHKDLAEQAVHGGAAEYLIKARGYLTTLPYTVKRILENEAERPLREKSQDLFARKHIPRRGYFILNHKGKFVSANPGMESISGYTEDELMELTLLDLLPRGKEWELFDWLKELEKRGPRKPFATDLVGKFDNSFPVLIHLTPVHDSYDQLKSYRGEIEEAQEQTEEYDRSDEEQTHLDILERLWEIMRSSRDDPMPKLLGNLAHLSCQFFKFQRATIAILDRAKQSYIKVAMIGYSLPLEAEKRKLEVPKEVIDRIFANKYRLKVLYYNQDNRQTNDFISPMLPDRRTQSRRPVEEWHHRDVVLLNLADRALQPFGYISLDDPAENFTPTRSFFHNLEIFSRLASLIIENHAHVMEQDQRNRRLTQILVTSNIFKLYLSMPELLKEIVWSIKFSLDFNLVALLLIGQKSGKAELRAVACDDKIVAQQLQTVSLTINEFRALMSTEFKLGKSFFIKRFHSSLQMIKRIYYRSAMNPRGEDEWPVDAAVFVPLKSRYGKIMGGILVDDPASLSVPDEEYLRTLEILANQVAVAIENRLMYVAVRRRSREEAEQAPEARPSPRAEYTNSREAYRRRSFWNKLFRDH